MSFLDEVKSAVPKDEMGSNKIFVGGLGQGVSTTHLRQYFETYGEIIDCVVMIDKRTQRSRGFGFVQFAHSEDAEAVIRDYGKHCFQDKWIEVKYAEPQESAPRPGNWGHDGSRRGSEQSSDSGYHQGIYTPTTCGETADYCQRLTRMESECTRVPSELTRVSSNMTTMTNPLSHHSTPTSGIREGELAPALPYTIDSSHAGGFHMPAPARTSPEFLPQSYPVPMMPTPAR